MKTNLFNHLTKIICSLIIMGCCTYQIQAKNLYVSVNNGYNANNPGTSANAPLKTLEAAQNRAQAGDVVNVMAGTYNHINQSVNAPFLSLLWIEKSGTPGNPITYRVNPGDEGKVILQNRISESAIHVNGADHIIIDGFKIKGQAAFQDHNTLANEYNTIKSNYLACGDDGACQWNALKPRNSGSGIVVQSYNHGNTNPALNVIVRNCDISQCTGAGIKANLSAKVLIESNKVYNCAKYSVLGESGISVFRPMNCNGQCSSFPNSADNKFSIIIRANKVSNNDNLFECNCSYPNPFTEKTDGNGIIIDQGRALSNTDKHLVENNIVFGNGGKGIHVFHSDNVNIINNSLYKNATRGNQYGRSDISVNVGNNIRIHNNITNPVIDAAQSMFITDATNVTISKNIHAKDIRNVGSTINRLNNLKRLPQFNTDYSLKSTSPAINFGNSAYSVSSKDFRRKNRVSGSSVDAGAIEFVGNPSTDSESCGKEKLRNNGFNTPNSNNIPQWTVFSGGGANMNGFINEWGVAKLNITNGGSNNYNLQLWQDGIRLEANVTYVLKFSIRGEKNRNARVIVRPVQFQNGQSEFYLSEQISFGSSFTEYTYHVKTNKTVANARLSFLLGGDKTNVFVDKVSLIKQCANGKLASTEIDNPQLANIYPNPVSDLLKIQLYNQIEAAEITLFDVHGKLLQRPTNATAGEVSIDVSKLLPGSYFIRIQSGDRVETQKILKF